MAVLQVNLTSESLHHLQMILEAAIDMTKPDGVAEAFKPIVDALHQMVVLASVTPHGTPVPKPTKDLGAANELRITLPRELNTTEQAMVAHLDHMLIICAQSIKNANATSDVVLEV